jgi:FMN phosphatase YigB (HAD superfamily)
MQQPIPNLETENREAELEEFFTANNIEGAIGDLDDTLIYTQKIFNESYCDFSKKICEELSLDPEEFTKTADLINSETHKARSVNPNRWDHYLAKLVEAYGREEKFLRYSEHFKQIYSVVPEVRPGAFELIHDFQTGGRKFPVLTHANIGWSYYKMHTTKLGFVVDDIVIADENGPKGPQDWLNAAERNGLNPKNTVVIGDNLKGDIMAAAEAEFGHLILLPAEWHYYGEGDVPPGTLVMPQHDLTQILPALMAHLGWNGHK